MLAVTFANKAVNNESLVSLSLKYIKMCLIDSIQFVKNNNLLLFGVCEMRGDKMV